LADDDESAGAAFASKMVALGNRLKEARLSVCFTALVLRKMLMIFPKQVWFI
jgi:hypothetical protein